MNATSPLPAAVAASASRPAILGLHHVTGITANAQANVDFYTATLGLQLVKLTVNFDDPQSYHLYYGDGLGRPGTIMTFFAWPGGRAGTPGTGQVSETAFAVPAGSLAFWRTRLASLGVPGLRETTRFGAPALTFRDPDGLALALVGTEQPDPVHLYPAGGIPAAHAIHGFHSVTLAETSETLPAAVLVNHFGYREAARENNRVRYQLAGIGAGRIVDIVTVTDRAYPGVGAGQIHHVAFRTPDDASQTTWLDLLRKDRRNVSPVMDRQYFHSIYFREPGGTLFEIATDTPGFAVDESPDALGTRLMLPAWLEPARSEIERLVPKLRLPARQRGVATPA